MLGTLGSFFILVAVHHPRKAFIFVLADGIKEFVFTTHFQIHEHTSGRERLYPADNL
jgi:hypothetical protein